MPDEPAKDADQSPRTEGAGPVPVARPAGTGAPGKVGEGSIYEIEATKCPRCGVELGSGDVVCVKCGYDLHANIVREPEVGVVHEDSGGPDGGSAAPRAEESQPEFVLAGTSEVRTIAIIGLVTLAGALVASGVRAGQVGGAGYVALMIGLTLYNGVIHTAMGVVAVTLAAKLLSYRMGRYEVAAARMLIVTSAFMLVANLPITAAMEPGILRSLVGAAVFVLAAGAYWVVFMLLFRKGRQPAALVMIVHAALWLLLTIGMWLAVLATQERPTVR